VHISLRLARVVAALVLLLSALPAAAQSTSTGRVTGRVTDAVTGAPLIGADIVVEGTSLVTATDQSGAFQLVGVPAGDATVVVSYLGHRQEQTKVSVVSGQAVTVEVTLAPVGFTETVQVQGDPIGEGQASALNQQRTAVNITNVVSADQIGSFPDPNAAEAASRIPGVSIARDQGEGRYVLIRGTESRLNSMLIDGERIPSPEGDVRAVALDAVPADQLQSIQVSKALTPDMDADAIGGAVNLVTKQAIDKTRSLFSVAGGYNALQEDYGQSNFSGTFGRRFSDRRAGFLLGGSAAKLHRGSENFEADYDDGDLEELQNRDYQITRERYAVNGTFDYRLSGTDGFVFRGIFNKFRDYEVNNRVEYQVGDERIERVLKNRQQDQLIASLSGTGQHLIGGATTLDYRFGWSRAQEEQPDRLDTVFRQSDVIFEPNVSLGSIDPDNVQANPLNADLSESFLEEQVYEPFLTRDRDFTASANVRTPLKTGASYTSFLKAGFKVRDKHKFRQADTIVAEPESDIPFASFQDPGFNEPDFMSYQGAGYVIGPGIQPSLARNHFNAQPSAAREFDHESDAADYDASETVVAGYAMAELYVGDRWLILPGLRYESTSVDYVGYDVLYNEDGDYVSTLPVSGGDTYGFLLPGFHVRFAATPSTNIRAAYSRTLARPNYYDLVPYQIVVTEDEEITRGNATLKPTTAQNLDLLVEHYFRSVGVVSGGVFYKRLNDYIYPSVFDEDIFGGEFEVTQPLNGESASLWGVELAFQNQLSFLPGPLDGLGVYANYTYTDSSATLPGRQGDARLPGQSAHVGNFSVWYEKAGFSAKSSWNFHGRYIDSVGETAVDDVYYDNHTQWDVNLSQRITRNVRLFADVLNLTNAPLRYYVGVTSRPIQEEYYRWWTNFGVKVNF